MAVRLHFKDTVFDLTGSKRSTQQCPRGCETKGSGRFLHYGLDQSSIANDGEMCAGSEKAATVEILISQCSFHCMKNKIPTNYCTCIADAAVFVGLC